ncbi:hypothetical protein ACGF07_03860 [Kitasatospora sp. NPDC048194]|uniref:hypothetical protein n=1 Tax=Kitasatospora sp. NPDC048194 TaxID=3364045 RepID=UPI003717CFA7
MRTSVINRSAKNDRTFSGRRSIAALAATAALAGGVQLLGAGDAWACSGPYQANNPTLSQEALARHYDGAPAATFIAPSPASLTAGSSAELGVEFANFTGADFDAAWPALTLKGNHLRAEDVTVEVMRGGAWTKLGIDNGCGGEAVRVDTSPLMQHLANGRASRVMFRIGLAADAPRGLASLSVSTTGLGEASAPGKSAGRTIKVVHPGTAEAAEPTTPAKPKPKPKPEPEPEPAAPAKKAEPAADSTPAKSTATPTVPSTAAPATTAPAGTPELARTGASSTDGVLAVGSAVLLALGGGVLIAVRRLRSQR